MSEFQRRIQDGSILRPFGHVQVKEVTNPYVAPCRRQLEAVVPRPQSWWQWLIKLIPEYNAKTIEKQKYDCSQILSNILNGTKKPLSSSQSHFEPSEYIKDAHDKAPEENGPTTDYLKTQLLTCPVCFEICSPPIFLCRCGHKICKHCRLRVENCPLCREEYYGTRDLGAEELFRKLKLKESPAPLIPEEEPEIEDEPQLTIETEQRRIEVEQLIIETEQRRIEIEQLRIEVEQLRIEAEQLRIEAEQLVIEAAEAERTAATPLILSPPAPAHQSRINISNNNPEWKVYERNGSGMYLWSSITRDDDDGIRTATPTTTTRYSLTFPDITNPNVKLHFPR